MKDTIVLKVGTRIPVDAAVSLIAPPRFVSRGGDKLAGALTDLAVSPNGRVCIDVGSSTGGFTDCLLQAGAQFVTAVDVGRGQLIESIKKHPRVKSFEETHILHFGSSQMERKPDLAVIDVSFISLKKILPHIKTLVSSNGEILALVKPQFEVGSRFLKKGVVKSVEVQKQAVDDIVHFALDQGFTYLGQSMSKLKGPKGNQEYFIHLKTAGA